MPIVSFLALSRLLDSCQDYNLKHIARYDFTLQTQTFQLLLATGWEFPEILLPWVRGCGSTGASAGWHAQPDGWRSGESTTVRGEPMLLKVKAQVYALRRIAFPEAGRD